MCLNIFFFEFILYGTLWVSWKWVASSFPMLGQFLTIISSKIFSYTFFFSPSSENPAIWMLVCLMLSQRSLSVSSFLFILLYLFCSPSVISTTLSLSSLTYTSKWLYYWFPLLYFYFSYCVVHCWWSVFYFFEVLVKHFCIFLVRASILFICASILLLRFWILFTIITLNSFSGRLPMSSSCVWFFRIFTVLHLLHFPQPLFHFV